MIIRRLTNNLTNPSYYFTQIFGGAAYLLLIVLWHYLKSNSNLEISSNQIILYFLTIYAFNYLFIFSLIDSIVERFQKKSEQFWLNPASSYKIILTKDFLPIIIDNLPLMFITTLASCVIGIFNFKALVLFIPLLILTHLCYFFLSITFAVLQTYLNWEWISFSLRYIGLPWNGSYLPLCLMSGIFSKITNLLPFLHSGLPMQLIICKEINLIFIINILVFTGIFILTSLILMRNYKNYVQD